MKLARSLLPLAIVSAAIAGVTPIHAEVRIGLAAPLTGNQAWAGGETVEGAEIAVADLNAQGGVLGERIELIAVDDYCDGEQAIAAANKLLADRVVMVFGHQCSGAAIPASKLYAEAGVLMISTFATNPGLTEQGLSNVFRVVGRDEVQGEIAADLLAKRWNDRPIAIIHDGEAYGKGLAEETKKGLNQRGVTEVMFDDVAPAQADYFDLIERMKSAGIVVLYYGGYAPEAAVIIRQARDSGYDLQLVSGRWPGQRGFCPDRGLGRGWRAHDAGSRPACQSRSATLAERLDRLGAEPTYTAYAAVQAWAQAVEQAGTFEVEAAADALRGGEFDTLLGRIGFDDKGDVTGYDTFVWYQWQGGDYAPVDPAPAHKVR